MKPRRGVQRRESRKDQAPVVVTFDDRGEVVDVVGDIAIFVGDGDTSKKMLCRLYDLLVADGMGAETLSAVEVSEGRYADVHILAEGSLRHLVLLDASDLMRVLRTRQQKDNEAALLHRVMQRELKSARLSAAGDDTYEQNGALFRCSNLLGAVIREMRAPVALVSGHARFLAAHVENDPIAAKSLVAIRSALVRLEALSTASLLGATEARVGQSADEENSLHELAIYLQDSFQLQAHLRGIEFEVRVSQRSSPAAVDFIALRHALLGLLVHALDVVEQRRLVVSLMHHGRGMDVELETSPVGFSAACFGALVTTRDLLYSNPSASMPLAISQQLLNNLFAKIELVPAQAGGYVLWFQCPPVEVNVDGNA